MSSSHDPFEDHLHPEPQTKPQLVVQSTAHNAFEDHLSPVPSNPPIVAQSAATAALDKQAAAEKQMLEDIERHRSAAESELHHHFPEFLRLKALMDEKLAAKGAKKAELKTLTDELHGTGLEDKKKEEIVKQCAALESELKHLKTQLKSLRGARQKMLEKPKSETDDEKNTRRHLRLLVETYEDPKKAYLHEQKVKHIKKAGAVIGFLDRAAGPILKVPVVGSVFDGIGAAVDIADAAFSKEGIGRRLTKIVVGAATIGLAIAAIVLGVVAAPLSGFAVAASAGISLVKSIHFLRKSKKDLDKAEGAVQQATLQLDQVKPAALKEAEKGLDKLIVEQKELALQLSQKKEQIKQGAVFKLDDIDKIHHAIKKNSAKIAEQKGTIKKEMHADKTVHEEIIKRERILHDLTEKRDKLKKERKDHRKNIGMSAGTFVGATLIAVGFFFPPALFAGVAVLGATALVGGAPYIKDAIMKVGSAVKKLGQGIMNIFKKSDDKETEDLTHKLKNKPKLQPAEDFAHRKQETLDPHKPAEELAHHKQEELHPRSSNVISIVRGLERDQHADHHVASHVQADLQDIAAHRVQDLDPIAPIKSKKPVLTLVPPLDAATPAPAVAPASAAKNGAQPKKAEEEEHQEYRRPRFR